MVVEFSRPSAETLQTIQECRLAGSRVVDPNLVSHERLKAIVIPRSSEEFIRMTVFFYRVVFWRKLQALTASEGTTESTAWRNAQLAVTRQGLKLCTMKIYRLKDSGDERHTTGAYTDGKMLLLSKRQSRLGVRLLAASFAFNISGSMLNFLPVSKSWPRFLMPFRLFRLVSTCLLISGLHLGSVLVAQTTEKVNWKSSPIEFEPNRGQAPSSAIYLARTQNLLFSLRENGMDLSFPRKNGGGRQLGFTFLNTSPAAEMRVSAPTGGESNYLIGSNAASWQTHVPHFERVTYKKLYPGIDLVFYGTGPRLEHDFIVAPGADPSIIRLHIEGDNARPTLNASGDLSVGTADDVVVMQKPEIYQIEGANRESVEGHFTLTANNEIGFHVGAYDRSRPLIIDPTLAVSTYLANLFLYMSAVATDAAGNTYVTGETFSSSYPVTAGSLQTTCESCVAEKPDIFVTKLNAAGTSQVFSTYLGGNDYDQSFSIAVDKSGNVIVAGTTSSTDFPVKLSVPHGPPGYAMTFGFISSLAPDGASLNYSSLLGGTTKLPSSTSSVNSIAVDQSGNAYITGTTESELFPVTALDCCAPAYPNPIVFVTKFLSTGQIGYSSLLGNPEPQDGGGGQVGSFALQVDGAGNAYVSGQAGMLWPVTSNAYQKQTQGRAPFVTKLDPTGTAVVYSTFLGNGAINGLAIDSVGNAWVTGTPDGADFPTTANAYQKTPPPSGCCVPFFSKLSADGSKLLYSSFFYGNSNVVGNSPAAIALDAGENVWLAGSTFDPQWPILQPVQGLPGSLNLGPSSSTGFVSRFTPAGTKLSFSTFFGGPLGGTHLAGLAIDGAGKVHIAGVAADDLYTTPGAFLPSVTPQAPPDSDTFGFVAVINPHVSSSAVCVAYPDNQSLFFGYVAVGHTAAHTLSITNCGTAPLTVNHFKPSGPEFTIPHSTDTCSNAAIAVSSSCTVVVNFRPTSPISYSETLSFASNASVRTNALNMQGIGAVPQIQSYETSVLFDPQLLGQTSPQQIVFITNAGFVPLVINFANTQITGDFAYTQSGCRQPLQQGSTCWFLLTFTPTAVGQRTGQFSIASNDPVTPVLAIALSGTGYSSYPVPVIVNVDTPTIPIGSTAAIIGVQGSNFFPASVAQINGVSLKTLYGGSELQVTIPPNFLGSLRELKLVVVNPAPGGGTSNPVVLTLYRSVPLSASDLVYDPASQLFFAAIPAAATSNPNTIIPVDPATGVVGTPIPVGNDPQHLAISGDGNYLYVALNADNAIQRINLKTKVIERTFALPIDPSFGQTTAFYMKVVPGSSQFLVVALFRNASPLEDGIALFNDKGLVNWLQNTYPDYPSVDSFTFAGDPSVVYAVPFPGRNSFFQSYSLSSSGIKTIVGGYGNQYENALIVSDGKLLYVADGTVWDPATGKQIAAYSPPLFFAAGIIPVPARTRTYFLDNYGPNGLAVESYSQVTGKLTGSVPFPSLGSGAFGLNRWGTNSFAFQVGNSASGQGSNQLILFSTTI
jgi:Abnormal spindle-like microcephaly-assoc'd, ASPM-SPD-2-Hydin/Beta-propeller repeat